MTTSSRSRGGTSSQEKGSTRNPGSARQTTIEPCAICGEPSVEEVEITPAVVEVRAGAKHQIKDAVKRWLCAAHKASAERDRGWQDRQAAAKRKRSRELKKAAESQTLFDTIPAQLKRPWEDVA